MDKEATKLQSQLEEPNLNETHPALVMNSQNINKEDSPEKRNLTILEMDAQETLESDLSCAICQDIYINPLVLNCSHSFCKFCIYSWLSKHKRCPQCRMAVCFQAENLALRNVVNKMILKSSEQFQKTRRTTVEQRLKDEETQSKTDRPDFLKNLARTSSMTTGNAAAAGGGGGDMDNSGFRFTNWFIIPHSMGGTDAARLVRARDLFNSVIEPIHDNNEGSEDTEDWEDYNGHEETEGEDLEEESEDDDDDDDYENPNRDETFELDEEDDDDDDLSDISESASSDNDVFEHEVLEDSSDLEIIGDSDSDTTEIDQGEPFEGTRWYAGRWNYGGIPAPGYFSQEESDMETLPYSDDSTIEYATSSSSSSSFSDW